MASYKPNSSGTGANRGFFNRILKDLSWGQRYDDLIIKNSTAIGKNEVPTPYGAENYYDMFSRNAMSSIFSQKAISALDKSYITKKGILKEYSKKDEIRDFVTIICDEAIVYDTEVGFAFAKSLPEEFSEEIKLKYLENYEQIYNRWKFNIGANAWSLFKSLIVDGFIVFEIIYDDRQKDIIGFKELSSETIMPGFDPVTGDRIWIQFADSPEFRRVFLDSQIIYISYAPGNDYTETSYVETLIRPYNQLKLLEQAIIMWNIQNAMCYKKFTVPVGTMSLHLAEQQVAKLIANYKDEVTWDEHMGVPHINGSQHISYNKEYWFPEGENGTPNMEIVKQDGHNLNDNDMITWFYNALKRASKIPFSRFDKDNGGGNVFGDNNQDVSRDEVSFNKFITRLREIFKEILIKPWRIKMILDFPELKDDENFLSSLDVEYNGYNLFNEWKELNNIAKRSEIVGTLSTSIKDSNEKPYFHTEFLVRRYMKIDEESLRENDRWKKISPTGTAEGGEGGLSEGGGTPSPSSESIPDFSSPSPEAEPSTPPPATEESGSPEPSGEETDF